MPGKRGERLPVERALVLRRVLVAGHEGHRRGRVAVGDGDAGVGGCGHARGHAGDHLERQRRPSRSASASSPPRPNTNGSPPFSRTTRRPCAPELHQQRVDVLLGHRDAPGCLADVEQVAVRAGAVERAGGHQAVVEDRVGLRDQLERARGSSGPGRRARRRRGRRCPRSSPHDTPRARLRRAAPAPRRPASARDRRGRARRGRRRPRRASRGSSSQPSGRPANASSTRSSPSQPGVGADRRVAGGVERRRPARARRSAPRARRGR